MKGQWTICIIIVLYNAHQLQGYCSVAHFFTRYVCLLTSENINTENKEPEIEHFIKETSQSKSTNLHMALINVNTTL